MVQKKQKYVSLYGRTSDGLSLVFVRAGPHKGYVTERVQSSVAWCQIAWLHRDRKSGHLNEQLCRKSPRRYFTLTLITSSGIQLIILLYESIWIISHVLWLWSMVRRIIAWFDTERCIVVFSFSFAQILCTTRPPRTAASFFAAWPSCTSATIGNTIGPRLARRTSGSAGTRTWCILTWVRLDVTWAARPRRLFSWPMDGTEIRGRTTCVLPCTGQMSIGK